MSRSLLALVIVVAVATALPAAAKEKDKEARARTEVRKVLEPYLDARFRGAPWKEYRDLVTWSEEQEEDEPCTTVVRSFNVADIRLKDKQTALATVVFYQLGTYCPGQHTFKPAPQLDNAIFQLRKRSIVWAVEKTSRPGGQVDWNVVRDRLQQQLDEPFLLADVRARATASLSLLERTANAIGRTSPEMRRPGTQKAPESDPTPAPK
jgi:hypothetical protein